MTPEPCTLDKEVAWPVFFFLKQGRKKQICGAAKISSHFIVQLTDLSVGPSIHEAL